MGDIDRALARAYARRLATAPPGGSPPPPHFAVEPGPAPGQALEWPRTVLALERAHGDRFEALAGALRVAGAGPGRLRSLLFTSCHRAEGRTTLVLSLARAMARRPHRTIVVDADPSGPMLAAALGLRPRFGLDDAVEGRAGLDEAIVDAADDHLAILPLRCAVADPREFFGSAGWAGAMARLRLDYDVVLIDGGPLFAALGEPLIPPAVDAAVLVHNRALTGPKAVLRAREAIDEVGLPLLGVAETFA